MFDRDQAAGLRELFTRSRPEVILTCGGSQEQARVVAELGLGLAAQMRQVLIIDGSAGEIAQVMGVAARYELGHVVAGDKDLTDVLVAGGPALRILPAMRGLEQLWRLSVPAARRLKRQFASELARVETLIVNCRPLGSLAAARAFQAGAHVLVIVSEHIESVTSAYREIKVLRLDFGMRECDVIVSNPTARAHANFESLAETAQHFLGVTLRLQGSLSSSRLGTQRNRVTTGVRADTRRPARAAMARQDKQFPGLYGTTERDTLRARLNQENAHAAIG